MFPPGSVPRLRLCALPATGSRASLRWPLSTAPSQATIPSDHTSWRGMIKSKEKGIKRDSSNYQLRVLRLFLPLFCEAGLSPLKVRHYLVDVREIDVHRP